MTDAAQHMQHLKLKELFSPEFIAARVEEAAAAVRRDYAGRKLTVICVLSGGVFFFTDLCRRLEGVEVTVDFIKASSYGDATSSSGQVRFEYGPQFEVKDRNILLVDDVLDSGLTLKALKEEFTARGARSVKLCVFVDKRERRLAKIQADYAGVRLEQGFIVGYGMDLAQRWRTLPGIFEVIKED